MFPILIGHAHTLKFAVYNTLTAVHAAIHVILQNKAFGSAVYCDQFNGLGGAIFDAKTAASTGGWVVKQVSTEALGGWILFKRIMLRAILSKQRSENIPEHGSNFHGI